MYKVGNGIKNGKRLIQNASLLFESNIKDINFIHFMISNFRKEYPDYIINIENFYNVDIQHILEKFNESKTDLMKVSRDFRQMLDSINKFNQDHSLILPKLNLNVFPKFSKETLEGLTKSSLDKKIEFLLKYIDKSEKNNSANLDEIIKLWDSISRKNFEGDINDLRKKSIGFIKQAFLSVPTVQKQLKNNTNNL